jgi:hypothetical protein
MYCSAVVATLRTEISNTCDGFSQMMMDNEEYPKLGIQYKAEETTENTGYTKN